ncbi:hypothetical protein J8L98_22215 [Pseudoalteromonas sp. MMG013]|uniref:hypothetical protein n=1 Tax=Pseudoalteromonas sp. MMG013 TaxID=2822687 RepID=UPI001B36A029|nr:hypothetical protein [Pseudoalteromonas sp. MMG013]MBQ4864411.1 hypothetical protein [Pseudoalteromonas sp. MMG013]
MDIKLIVALIGITGVGISALIQYYLGRRNEKIKKAIDIRAQAYVDLTNIVAEIASSKERSSEQFQQLTKAKSRVILIGSENVIHEMHSFFTNYGILDSEDAHTSFAKIIAAMRTDLSGDNKLSLNILTESLF